MSNLPCTPAPDAPNDSPPVDWADTVHGNCFTNLQRLGCWTGGPELLPDNSPVGCFTSVTKGSLGGETDPPAIYVVTHGWAPGYLSAVQAAGGNLLWWDEKAAVNGVWASDWAWSKVVAPTPLTVNPTGVIQSILRFDPTAIVLAYSWIDDSATDTFNWDYYTATEVYRSEAYTHINGLRLANALVEAIAPSYWKSASAKLHLIGHSHGSKVATVAASTLQQRSLPVARLSILDAPETEGTLYNNAANMLGFYLEGMTIADPCKPGSQGTLVDNYVSCFGVDYSGTPSLSNVGEIVLDPAQLYGSYDYGDLHTYAAAWYGGATMMAGKTAGLGLDWPPVPANYQSPLGQPWNGGITQQNQWVLQSGTPTYIYAYQQNSAAPFVNSTDGNVQVQGSDWTFGIGTNSSLYSYLYGTYYVASEQYGLTFDVAWTSPQDGDYLVVSITGYSDTLDEYILLVMDGKSAPAGSTSVAVNADISYLWGIYQVADIKVYFYQAQSGSSSSVTISNLQGASVPSADSASPQRRKPQIRPEQAQSLSEPL